VLFKALDGCTYNLLEAKGCKKALSITRKANSDLVLRDIMMLGVAYYAVCRR
jgi:CheY-like chemotaxis protein